MPQSSIIDSILRAQAGLQQFAPDVNAPLVEHLAELHRIADAALALSQFAEAQANKLACGDARKAVNDALERRAQYSARLPPPGFQEGMDAEDALKATWSSKQSRAPLHLDTTQSMIAHSSGQWSARLPPAQQLGGALG